MKTFQLFFLGLFLSISSFAQISFTATSMKQATTQANDANKLIFVDAYTTWCGPCKWMAKNVFTDTNVGEYYNENFVNFKIDMEKGEGPELAKKWNITGYPTLLFLDASGEVIHRSMGSRPAVDFLDLGNAANDPERQVITMKKRFKAGERSADFLKKYTDALTSSGMKGFGEVAQLYMDTQKDWSSAENMNFIFDYAEASFDSKLFRYTLDHKEAFIALVGAEKFDQKLNYAADLDRSKAGISRDDVEALKIHYAIYYPEDVAEQKAMISYFNEVMYSPDPVEQEKFKSEIQLFLAAEPELTWNFYNSVAWQIYEITTDQYLLKKAARWTDLSIQKDENSFNTDTQAAIQFKLGNFDLARGYAIKSIELAKENNNDYRATEELLRKIMMKN